jgi:hypothetical protein
MISGAGAAQSPARLIPLVENLRLLASNNRPHNAVLAGAYDLSRRGAESESDKVVMMARVDLVNCSASAGAKRRSV